MSSWKKLSSRTIYRSPYFKVREDQAINPQGKKGTYYVVDILGAVAVVALDKKQNIYLLREDKYLPGEIWTIPAGKMSPGEKPLTTAKRELKEETGLTAKKWTALGQFLQAPGHSSGFGHCFLAQDLKEGRQQLTGSEKIKVVKVSFPKAITMIKKNQIIDAWAIIPIFKTKLHLGL